MLVSVYENISLCFTLILQPEYLLICISDHLLKVKLAILVEGDPKAPFSIATTPKCKGATPFPGLLHFTFDPYLIMLSVNQGSIKNHFFLSLV